MPSGNVIIVQVLHPSYHTEQLSVVGRETEFEFSGCMTLLSNIPTVKRIKNRITGNTINLFRFIIFEINSWQS